MSDRLTFSLTSLIFLIALGLVFAPMSVMAHSTADLGTLASHSHPTDAIPADANASPPTTGVSEHGEHPTVVSITAVAVATTADNVKKMGDITYIALDSDAETTNPPNTVNLIVEFDREVNAGTSALSSSTAIVAAEVLESSGFEFVVVDEDGFTDGNAFGTGNDQIEFGTSTRYSSGDPVTVSNKKFVVPLTFGTDLIPTATKPQTKLVFRIRAKADAAKSIRKTYDGETKLYSGAPSSSSDAYSFTLVSKLPTDPVTPTPPTVEITPPTKQATNGDLVFTFAFSKELGNASNDLQAGDIDVTGGTVASVVQDTTDTKKYKVTVTPTDTPPQVSLSLRAESVADPAGNFIDLTGANDGKSAYDKVFPTVLGHTSDVATVTPTGGSDDHTYLEFTFTFSEPINKSKMTVDAVDQGASHNARFNRSYFFDASDTSGDATNSYTITVRVEDPKKATTIALKIGTGSVADMAGNGLAESYTATHSATDNTAPVFATATVPPDDKQGLNWCEDQTRAAVVLPRAKDSEGDALTYALSANAKGHVIPANPATVPTSGLYWITIDTETRHLLGKAEMDDAGTYTWTATDANGKNTVKPVQITIVVKAHQPPAKPTGFKAEKVDSAAKQGPTMDRVKLSWDVPTSKTGWSDCIPDVDSYTLMVDKYDEAMEKFVTHPMPKSTFTVASDLTTNNGKYGLALDTLPKGIYRFQIEPHNLSTLASPKSDYATWKKTGGNRVVVADPPAWDLRNSPADLDASIQPNGNNVTLDWNKVPDELDGGAPINDEASATQMKYYGISGDHAGYVVYRSNHQTKAVKRLPATGFVPAAGSGTGIDFYEHPTYLDANVPAGQYVYRVEAVNVAGASLDSISTKIITIVAPSTPPTPTLPFGSVTASYMEGNTTTTISAGMINSNNFAVVYADALPDLELFFSQGGSITLMDPGAAPAKSVVISEILWGLDYGEPAASQKKHQFIELYNTNISGDIDLAGWKLVFTRGAPAPATDVDQVSNVAGVGWIVNVGQSGRIANTTLTGGTVPPTELISMYRTINFAKVQNTDGGKIEERFKDFPNGNAASGWAVSTRVTTQTSIKSSPGRRPFKPFEPIKATEVKRDTFVINEIGNDTDGTNDWIELKNVSDAEQSLKNYQLSVVTGDHDMEYDKDKHKDTQLFHFHDKDLKVPAKGVVLIASTDPVNTDIAAGRNLEKSVDDQDPTGLGGDVIYIVRSFNLPDTGKTLLILRNNHETKHLGTEAHIKDVVGTLKIKLTSTGTSLWPLKATGAPNGNVIDGTDDEDFRAGKVYKRNNAGGGTGEKHLGTVGYTGIGYDRVAADSAVNGGTPGYANDTLKEYKDKKNDQESDAPVTITEIMLDVGEGRQNLPQWIELYNSSLTEAVSINGWKLIIENNDDPEEPAVTVDDATLTFGDVRIQPNQTILIVSTSGRTSDPDHFPATRVINLWTTKAHRDALEMTRRTDQVFSATGFYFKLMDKGNNRVDEVGNLDGNRRTRDEPAWALPMSQEEDRRSSLMRVHDRGVAEDGMIADGWIRSDTTSLAYTISETYYGDPDDFGTPGFRAGGPLPVSLSKFRPERLEDGSIRIVWVTESELNNAGFNILRSEKRDGEFKQINTKLIAGKGTTSERNTYTHTDTSAKPDVVYYYQIQDVSFDGKVQTLRQSRLKGDVSAAGKATTTWGELKALQ